MALSAMADNWNAGDCGMRCSSAEAAVKFPSLLLLCGLPALALDNSVTVHNNYTGTMSNHPIWFGRWFAQGEVPDYCKPFATPSNTSIRAAVNEWQCSVQNRWRDGTAVRNITGVRTGSPIWSNAAGLTNIVVSSD